MCLFPFALFGANFTFSGETWYDYTKYEINNINTSFSGYIPQFKYKYNNIDDVHDFSLIYSSKFIYDVKNSINESKTYRSYLKYSYKDKFSTQIGLQKISFGNSLILRPLNWFDTLDYRTVADHTQGVDAIKLNFYFLDYEVMLWSILDDYNSYGLRYKRYINRGTFGLTFFHDRDKSNHSIYNTIQFIENQPEPQFPGSNYRIGFDYRYDNIIGLWIEGNTINSSLNDFNENRLDLITVGFDYTVPVYNGILLLSETMHSSIVSEDINILNQASTAFMASTPIGMFNDLSLICLYDMQSYDSFNLIRWTTTFDLFRISVSYSINPEQFGNSTQLMFIYNH
tara:strand:+ start:257 stop:1279 length:1023 start_codon:yes stop_codon:yes gene_type:complete